MKLQTFFLVLQQSACFRLDGKTSILGVCLYRTSFIRKIHFLIVSNHLKVTDLYYLSKLIKTSAPWVGKKRELCADDKNDIFLKNLMCHKVLPKMYFVK